MAKKRDCGCYARIRKREFLQDNYPKKSWGRTWASRRQHPVIREGDGEFFIENLLAYEKE